MCCRAVTLRLAPLLPTNVAVAQFPDVRAAAEAVTEIVNSGVGIRESRTDPRNVTVSPDWESP